MIEQLLLDIEIEVGSGYAISSTFHFLLTVGVNYLIEHNIIKHFSMVLRQIIYVLPVILTLVEINEDQ